MVGLFNFQFYKHGYVAIKLLGTILLRLLWQMFVVVCIVCTWHVPDTKLHDWAIPFNDDTPLLRKNLGILIVQT